MSATRSDRKNSKVSKDLSAVLRHQAVSLGLEMRPDGYISCAELLMLPQFTDMTVSQLKTVVDACPKRRFEMKIDEDGTDWIRAAQGHSITGLDEEKLFAKIDDASEIPLCVHGTCTKNWEQIKTEGLKVQERTHIHFAAGEPRHGKVMSGARPSANVFIYIDVPAAMEAGIQFFRSSNNVILSKGIEGVISPEFFQRAVLLQKGLSDVEIPLVDR